jgi:hypothetical protein
VSFETRDPRLEPVSARGSAEAARAHEPERDHAHGVDAQLTIESPDLYRHYGGSTEHRKESRTAPEWA